MDPKRERAKKQRKAMENAVSEWISVEEGESYIEKERERNRGAAKNG